MASSDLQVSASGGTDQAGHLPVSTSMAWSRCPHITIGRLNRQRPGRGRVTIMIMLPWRAPGPGQPRRWPAPVGNQAAATGTCLQAAEPRGHEARGLTRSGPRRTVTEAAFALADTAVASSAGDLT